MDCSHSDDHGLCLPTHPTESKPEQRASPGKGFGSLSDLSKLALLCTSTIVQCACTPYSCQTYRQLMYEIKSIVALQLRLEPPTKQLGHGTKAALTTHHCRQPMYEKMLCRTRARCSSYTPNVQRKDALKCLTNIVLLRSCQGIHCSIQHTLMVQTTEFHTD